MRFAKTLAGSTLAAIAAVCGVAAVQAAPLPTNIGTMKAMVADDTVQQVRWGGGWGYRGGFGGYRGGWGGGWGYRGYGYRPWAGVAAGAIVGGAIARSAYYGYGGGYPYYGYGGGYYGGGYAPVYSGYGDDYCPPSVGYGGYGYSYRRYYGW